MYISFLTITVCIYIFIVLSAVLSYTAVNIYCYVYSKKININRFIRKSVIWLYNERLINFDTYRKMLTAIQIKSHTDFINKVIIVTIMGSIYIAISPAIITVYLMLLLLYPVKHAIIALRKRKCTKESALWMKRNS
jgi:hypothetical protein